MAIKLGIFQASVVDDKGNVVPGATITVTATTVGSPFASLFSNRDGTGAKSNPYVTSDGIIKFYAAGGSYDIVATKGALTRTWSNVGIGTAAEYDASDLLFAFAIQFGATGKPLASEALLPFEVPLAMTVPADAFGCHARVRVAPTTIKVVTLMFSSGGNTAGVSIGTVTFAANSREGVFAIPDDVDLNTGDQIWPIMPNPASTVMTDFSMVILARR